MPAGSVEVAIPTTRMEIGNVASPGVGASPSPITEPVA